MRTVCYVSGSRADYGPALSVLRRIQGDPRFELSIAVTAMHLDPLHGDTWREVQEDGFTIATTVHGRHEGDSLDAMAKSFGAYVSGFSEYFAQHRPDIVLVLGDRSETLAATIAAAFHNLTIAHLCGGSQSGSIDDSIRHAITKFAHYHLVAEQSHYDRVVQMGEAPQRVTLVGLPGGDLADDVIYSKDEVCDRLGLPAGSQYALVIQHSVTHQQEAATSQIVETLAALADIKMPVLLANPNDDAGGRQILAAMNSAARESAHFRILASPRSRAWFASIMAHAELLVGNSSSGTVEAASVGLPVINIGQRQSGREAASCMISVPHDRVKIKGALAEAMSATSAYRSKLDSFQSQLVRNDTAGAVLAVLAELNCEEGRSGKGFFVA